MNGPQSKNDTGKWRGDMDAWCKSVDEKFDFMEVKIGSLAKGHSELKEGQETQIKVSQESSDLIKKNTELTEDIYEIINTARSFFRFLGWIGRKGSLIAKPIGVIAVAITAVWVLVYQLLHNGNLPK